MFFQQVFCDVTSNAFVSERSLSQEDDELRGVADVESVTVNDVFDVAHVSK